MATTTTQQLSEAHERLAEIRIRRADLKARHAETLKALTRQETEAARRVRDLEAVEAAASVVIPPRVPNSPVEPLSERLTVLLGLVGHPIGPAQAAALLNTDKTRPGVTAAVVGSTLYRRKQFVPAEGGGYRLASP